jgi:hypothetical protein
MTKRKFPIYLHSTISDWNISFKFYQYDHWFNSAMGNESTKRELSVDHGYHEQKQRSPKPVGIYG